MSLQTVKGMQPLAEATKYIGRQKFLEAVYLAALNEDKGAVAFWRIWEDLTESEQKIVAFDEVALLAGVAAHELMSSAVGAAMLLGSRTSEMVYATMQPNVVRQMMKSAMRIGGKHAQIAMLDRHKALQHGAFLPVPHGQTINVNATSKADAKAAAAAEANTHPSVPSFLEDMDDLDAPKQVVQRQLLTETFSRAVDSDPDV
jgi:hypothetical protein